MGAHERVRFRDTGKRPLVEVSPALIQCHRRNRGGRQDLAESAAGHLAQLAQADVPCRTAQAIGSNLVQNRCSLSAILL
jgi:hypothetical protein